MPPAARATVGQTDRGTQDLTVTPLEGTFAGDSLHEEEIDLVHPLTGDISAGTSAGSCSLCNAQTSGSAEGPSAR